MAKIVGIRDGSIVQAAAGLPTGDDAKKLILATSAVIGGVALGAAAAGSVKHGWVDDVRPGPPPDLAEEALVFGAFNVAMVLSGASLLQAMDQYGTRNVVVGMSGLAAAVALLRWMRS